MSERDYVIVGPDGRELTITGPVGATPEQLRAAAEKAFAVPQKSVGQRIAQQAGNLVAGAVRGAGSIGATLLAPVDIASDLMDGKGLSLQSNRERRAKMDAALGNLGADTGSLAYTGGKLAAEVAGTAGAGGALANAASKVPALAASPNLLQAIRTAGMEGGNALTRAAGGAITGAASAGMVNPEDAATGAAVGGALPGALQLAGKAGNAIGSLVRGPAQPEDLKAAVTAARESGYVIPPTQAKPSFANRTIEGLSGKITTAQNASARNQAVTNAKAATAIGLPAETTITPDVLDAVRKEAGQAYGAVAKLGTLDATGAKLPAVVQVEEGINPLIGGKTQSVDASELVRAWKQSNADATAYYRAYARDANPETLAKAKANAAASKQIDEFLSKQLDNMGLSDLGEALKAARVRIAKTYSVEGALNPSTGTVDARKLAKQLEKGKALSGELKDAAEFAGRFPKAAQAVEGMGSLPQTSPLDWALGGSLAAAASNPLMLATVMARPAARRLALSPVVQDRLVSDGGQNALVRLLQNPQAAQLGYRAAPVLVADQ